MALLLDEAQASRLTFSCQQDALDHTNKLVEDNKRWLATHNRNVTKHYELGKIEVVLKVGSGLASDYDLVFRAVPMHSLRGDDDARRTHDIKDSALGPESDRRENHML